MTAEDRQKIVQLVKRYSKEIGTESLINFVAETSGMLAASQKLLKCINAGDQKNRDFLDRECKTYGVSFQSFVEEISHIVNLFHPNQDKDTCYSILGLTEGAGSEEIKSAYRKLSMQFHPDTAPQEFRDNPEKFIAITQAYNFLLGSEQKENHEQKKQWLKKKARSVSDTQRSKTLIWSFALLVVVIVISVVASIHYKKRAMIAGLQESRGNFSPQVKTKVDSVKVVVQTEKRRLLADERVTVEIPPKFDLKNSEPTKVEKTTLPSLKTPQIEEKKIVVAPKEIFPVEKKKESPDRVVADAVDQNIVIAQKNDVHQPDAEKKDQVTAPIEQRKKSNKNGDIAAATESDSKKANPTNESRPDATVEHLADAQVVEQTVATQKLDDQARQKKEEASLQITIEKFLADYEKAYRQRNAILFSRFFTADAMENGKPFTAMLSVYMDLFAKTSDTSLVIKTISLQQIDGGVAVVGRFTVYLHYTNDREYRGKGPINLFLINDSGKLLISSMQYTFDPE